MSGRNILEGVVILHETILELHRKKKNWVILKLDFEQSQLGLCAADSQDEGLLTSVG